MRIIAGSAKGTRLARPPSGTRPVSDRAREGVFSSLGELVAEARCLDLFAGTGAMGIEALSRGAASCVFVDASAGAIKVIRENLNRAKVEEAATVVKADAARFLQRVPGPFDLAFVDPPYDLVAVREIAAALPPILDRNGRFVLTRPARSPTDVVPVDWLIERRLSYGDTLVLVCREDR